MIVSKTLAALTDGPSTPLQVALHVSPIDGNLWRQ